MNPALLVKNDVANVRCMFEKAVLILLPIFVVIGFGYFSERLNILGENSAKVLGRFVTHVSLPILLFGALAKEPFERIFDLPFVVSFGLGTLICFLLPWILMPTSKVSLGERAMQGLGTSFPAVAFVGIPVLTPLVGTVALPAVGVSNIIVLAVMAIAIVLVETDRGGANNFFQALITALLHCFKNPIIIGALAGLAYSLSELPLPVWISKTTEMVGVATPAVALFALGQALVKTRLDHLGEISLLTAVKLIAMPLITLGLLQLFPQVDTKWAIAAVVTAAMPTAVLEYILAEELHQDVESASGLVLLTTLLSAVTLPIFIILCLHIWPIT